MNVIKIYLIRHGKTYCNEQNLYYGKSDVDVCEAGIKELNEKKNKIKYPVCEFYFTSGAKRANQTLDIIRPKTNYIKLPKFFEYDFGDFELKSYEEIKDRKEYSEWMADKEGNVKCPNGESKGEFRNRIGEGFKELIEYLIREKIRTALGVIHGGSIGMILEMLYDDKKKFYEWQPNNGEGYELTVRIEGNKNFIIEKIKNIHLE